MGLRSIHASLRRAQELRRQAIAQLAKESRPDSPAFLMSPELEQALAKHTPRIKATHGYVGHAIGRRRRDGQFVPELAVTVFVAKKLSKRTLATVAQHAAPAQLKIAKGSPIATDVVELKLIKKQASAYPGGYVGSEVEPTAGTLTCFAKKGDGTLIALTAGHVAREQGSYDIPYSSGHVIGTLDQTLQTSIDSASIIVTSDYTQQLPDGTKMEGWRIVSEHDLHPPIKVHLYGAQTGGWSGGELLYVAQRIDNWNLDDALIYSAASADGDSGGPIIDDQRYLIGQHVGRGCAYGQPIAIANSMANVVSRLAVNLDFEESV